VVLFSYRTKRESPAGDQFWKFSRQCSIFGRIGDQWVAISSPALIAADKIGNSATKTSDHLKWWSGPWRATNRNNTYREIPG